MSQELIERLREEAAYLEKQNSSLLSTPTSLRDAAEALASKDKRIAEYEEADRAKPSFSNPEDGVHEIIADYRELINSTPELTSLLYDIDMLPEQCVTRAGAIRLAGLCEVWKLKVAAESVLSLAESRGRQIGRQEAAKVAEDLELAYGVRASAEGVPIHTRAHLLHRGSGCHHVAAAIRNLPTNEAGE